MVNSDIALRELVTAIVAGQPGSVSRLLAASPHLAHASFKNGATRQSAIAFHFDQIGRYIYAGDTALHFAAAAYQTDIARELLASGADVHAKNRRGQEPLHAASVGNPNLGTWNPSLQTATIILLVQSGADPNVTDKSGVSPLHKAIRTRCEAAVHTLLDCGADPVRPNKNGSTPILLATLNTGRGGTGSPVAKSQQQQILRLLNNSVKAP
jgi:hypothetical protein